MVICAVINCNNRSGRNCRVSFFSFPRIITNKGNKCKQTSMKRLQEWLCRINREDLNNNSNLKNMRVCSVHFIKGKPSSLLDSTNVDWAPSLRLGYSKYEGKGNKVDIYARLPGDGESSSSNSGTYNNIVLAEQSVTIRKEGLVRAEEKLKLAKDLKERTSSHVISIEREVVGIEYPKYAQSICNKLITKAKETDALAEENIAVAEKDLRHAEESLTSSLEILELMKDNSKSEIRD